MHSVFDPSGYNVRVVGGVDAALPLARALRPDLIICDVVMPDNSGFDQYKREGFVYTFVRHVKPDQLRKIPKDVPRS